MTVKIADGVEWEPPAGMTPTNRNMWAAFYRAAFTNYKVTPQQYRAMYLAQSGRCFICRVAKGRHPDDPKARGGRRLGVDHNHTTRQVRGLLCTGGDKTCNRIIGWLTGEALRRAAAYVDHPPAPRVVQALQRGWGDAQILGMVVPDAEDHPS